MGQKTHPIGLRLGSNRKWASSWYGEMHKASFFKITGIIASRGGIHYAGPEARLVSIFKRYSRTKFRKSNKIALVDFRLFKGFGGHLYGFRIYIKIVGARLEILVWCK